ncbi:hypothetical protein AXF42_Ash005623 [Apostasia shenzhenica]|uniref:Uncharacterized protein n=1 Tax=Apostasia shenzhenica TaxID=1088818 RepID=A0A2I0BBY5_9ASPA|nr:hypothetical protein AXF42_Ash005623 [Apostasia shenzhenica]
MAATATHRGKPQTHLLRRDFSPVTNPGGNQRLLRCEAIDGEQRSMLKATERESRRPIPRIGAPDSGADDDGGIEELRAKLLGHLREAADRLKLEIPQIGPAPPPVAEIMVERLETKPDPMPFSGNARMRWSMRTRRAAQVIPTAKAAERTVRLRSEDTEKKEPLKFSITLSRDEIAEDVFVLTGCRPRRRPRKRPRIVQRLLDVSPNPFFPSSPPAVLH